MVRKRGNLIRNISNLITRETYARLSPFATGHSMGLVAVIFMIIYALMAWFSNYDTSVIIAQFPVPFSLTSWTLIIGLIESYVFGYIAGWIFAGIYNKSRRY